MDNYTLTTFYHPFWTAIAFCVTVERVGAKSGSTGACPKRKLRLQCYRDREQQFDCLKPCIMPPKKKEEVTEKPILGRFSSHLKMYVYCTHVALVRRDCLHADTRHRWFLQLSGVHLHQCCPVIAKLCVLPVPHGRCSDMVYSEGVS